MLHWNQKIMNLSNSAPNPKRNKFERLERFNSVNEKIMPETIHAIHDLSPYMKTRRFKVPIKSTLLTVLLSTIAFLFVKAFIPILTRKIPAIGNMPGGASYIFESVIYALILGLTLMLSFGINYAKNK
jgi:hypothetical protein